ncbi:MAG: glycosyl transferase, partial [Hyphomicrobiales bacterium]|nr:glycosyl transferase [Hyphomicrobiales bacterium]
MAPLTSFLRAALAFAPARPPWRDLDPIREELFGVERLEEHARSLAVAQTVLPRRSAGRPLAGRLADNRTALLRAYRAAVDAIGGGRAMTPAAEWLVDNFHLVEKQIDAIRADLPPGYYRQLPKLATAPFAGYPRVFGMAWAFVAHTDSRFDSEALVRFALAYQDVQPLTIGELWALSITLRIVLVENLRRLASEITVGGAERRKADAVADRLLGIDDEAAEPVATVVKSLEGRPLSPAFAVQLAHRLRDRDPKVTPALDWLEGRLAAQGATADEAVREVHRRQGAANVSVRNAITGLRMISEVDWKKIFERISIVDSILAEGGGFREMDFRTRTLYRAAIEDLARGSGREELDVARSARAATSRAAAAAPESERARRGDVGYALVGGGRREFETSIGYRPPARNRLARINRAVGVGGYVGAIGLVAACLAAAPLYFLASAGMAWVALAAFAALGAVPAVDGAVALVNRAANFGFAASPLPEMELLGGIPARSRTLVAVPTLLSTLSGVEELIERLEVHHLASPDGALHFALVTDWLDSPTQGADGDAGLVAAAAAGVARLNLRHGPAQGGARFLLLHRRRVWNAGEARWIGWERKRGKLHELNRLLRAAADTTFMDLGADLPAPPSGVRYVVTLDSDTRLPRDAVRRLVGKMAHPLNRPRLDATTRRVVEGHAIIQPRVTPSLPNDRQGSLLQRIFSSVGGIDPYASAVSDVYQDLFGEGSYAGKGIYDVDAFEASL